MSNTLSLFTIILLHLAPLYLNILLGFIAGKAIGTPCDPIARIMFFIINPLIMFNGILYTRLDASVLSLPFIVLGISCLLSFLFYSWARTIWRDASKNLIGFSAGSGNAGYFGLPLAILLLDNQGEGVYMMAILGLVLYESTMGFYLVAKGIHTPADCFQRLIRLPTLHAFLLALVINVLKVPIPSVFADFMCHIKGTYTVLGMMIVGISLSCLNHYQLDLKFIGMTFLAKFLCWPILILAIIYADSHWFHIYTRDIHNALLILSIVPLPVNSVIFASVLKTLPEKAATAVLCSTLFALIFVPTMILFFMPEAMELLNSPLCTPPLPYQP